MIREHQLLIHCVTEIANAVAECERWDATPFSREGITMENGKSLSKAKAPKKLFKDMTRNQKSVFVLQLLVFICTLGLVFGNLMDLTDKGVKPV